MQKMLDDTGIKDWTMANEFDTKTFHPFLRLPPELQDMVWGLSLPGPRVLTVEVKIDDTLIRDEDNDWDTSEYNQLRFNKSYHLPNPALLSTCRSSRRVAEKTYKLAFGTLNVFADFEKDVFYFVSCTRFFERGEWDWFFNLHLYEIFGNPSYLRLAPKDSLIHDLLKISHILLDYDIVDLYKRARGAAERWEPRKNLQNFRNLKTLSFLVSRTSLPYKEHGQRMVSEFDPEKPVQDWCDPSDLTTLAKEVIDDFYHMAIPNTLEESMTEEQLLEQTSKYQTQLVTLKKLNNRELLREQEFRTGTGQGGKELYVSSHTILSQYVTILTPVVRSWRGEITLLT
jgi:hypothetical protein